jgi:hypothetical protein
MHGHLNIKYDEANSCFFCNFAILRKRLVTINYDNVRSIDQKKAIISTGLLHGTIVNIFV